VLSTRTDERSCVRPGGSPPGRFASGPRLWWVRLCHRWCQHSPSNAIRG
jgi:hypothetical protein